MKVFASLAIPPEGITVARLESWCIQAAHAGQAQGLVKVVDNEIQILIPKQEKQNHEQQIQ